MPLTFQNVSGDALVDPFLAITVVLPDSGTSIVVQGAVQALANAMVAITGSPLSGTACPPAQITYYIIQVNWTTGAASLKTSTASMPTPDAGNLLIYSDTLQVSDTALSKDPGVSPDEW